MDNDQIYHSMADFIGLDLVLVQNDLEPWQVLKVLHEQGLLDTEDYIYEELKVDD
jgi:hypothetical protein